MAVLLHICHVFVGAFFYIVVGFMLLHIMMCCFHEINSDIYRIYALKIKINPNTHVILTVS